MTIDERTKDLTTRLRPMAVLSDGIWQKAEGVWIDIGSYTAKVILNGKELVCDGKHVLDLDGYKSIDIARTIMRNNISTLPQKKKQTSIGNSDTTKATWL